MPGIRAISGALDPITGQRKQCVFEWCTAQGAMVEHHQGWLNIAHLGEE